MPARPAAARGLLLVASWMLAMSVLGGCASTGAPDGWLPKAQDAGRDPYGAWITVNARDQSTMSGEFIAISSDSLHVLVGDDLVSLAWRDVETARVAHFDPQSAGGWVALGAVSTVSHGVLLVISLPIWLLGGSASARTHVQKALVDFPDHGPDDLGPYARFPQGLPPGLDRQSLVPKPFTWPTNREIPSDPAGAEVGRPNP